MNPLKKGQLREEDRYGVIINRPTEGVWTGILVVIEQSDSYWCN